MHTKGVLCASCMKGIYAPKGFGHPDRVLHPLKRVGERGSGQWLGRRHGRHDWLQRRGNEPLPVRHLQEG